MRIFAPHGPLAAGYACLILACLPQDIRAASFSCDTARAPKEKLICGDPILDRLDSQLGAAYQKLLGLLPEIARNGQTKDELDWIARTDRACGFTASLRVGPDNRDTLVACLTSATRERAAYLEGEYTKLNTMLARSRNMGTTETKDRQARNEKLDAITPISPRLSGSAAFFGSPPTRPGTGEPSRMARNPFEKIEVEAAETALTKAAMFDDLEEAFGADVAQGNEGKDFAVWRMGILWWIRYRDGFPLSIRATTQDPANWLVQLRAAGEQARAGTGELNLAFVYMFDKGGTVPVFMGIPYDDPAKLAAAATAAFTHRFANIAPVSERLGGAALIALPGTTDWSSMTWINKDNPVAAEKMRQMDQAYGIAEFTVEADAIRRSNLFDRVTIRTAGIDDCPDGDGFDYVIFYCGGGVRQWQLKGRDGVVRPFTLLNHAPTADGWLAALRDDLRGLGQVP